MVQKGDELMVNEHDYNENDEQSNEGRPDEGTDFQDSRDSYGWDDQPTDRKCSHGKLLLIIAVLSAVAGYFFFKYRCASGQCSSDLCGTLDRKQQQAQKALAKTVKTAGSAVDDTTDKIRESVQQLLA
jgi:hypothetical protein